MFMWVFVLIKSLYFTILGWSKHFNKFISVSIDFINSCEILWRSICFIATVSAVSVSNALKTSPTAPFPIDSPICYFLIFLNLAKIKKI